MKSSILLLALTITGCSCEDKPTVQAAQPPVVVMPQQQPTAPDSGPSPLSAWILGYMIGSMHSGQPRIVEHHTYVSPSPAVPRRSYSAPVRSYPSRSYSSRSYSARR